MKKFIFFSIILTSLFAYKAAGAESPGFSLTYQGKNFPVSAAELASWQNQTVVSGSTTIKREAMSPYLLLLYYVGGQNQERNLQTSYAYQPQKIYDFVQSIAATVNTPTIEPELTIENGRATYFVPPHDGVTVDAYQTTLDILNSLEKNATSTELSASTTSPKTLLSETNTSGIRELIAEGVSVFKGSPSNRRHNIKVGVEKMAGVIVGPGQEFSFNDNLGPVDGEHGFLPELVIKSNATVPEFGGGLCQVSTTTFRAAMQAGLPITQRRNHAYAVQYYSPQGTDATIYPGVIDLKFINDTAGSILIWPYLKDTNTLIFDFYGTKDDRTVTLEKPVQFDRKPDGSMKATWTREVTKDGMTATSTFKSTYQPPALFHKHEEFVSATAPAGFHVGAPSPTPPPPTPTHN